MLLIMIKLFGTIFMQMNTKLTILSLLPWPLITGYCEHGSTETALLNIHDHLLKLYAYKNVGTAYTG